MNIRHSFTILTFALLVASTIARPLESWSYDRLFKEADVVVIASAGETVQSEDKAYDQRWQKSLTGQHTAFSVISVLKGQLNDGSLTVLHFKLKDGVNTSNGPFLVAFRTKVRSIGKIQGIVRPAAVPAVS